MSQIILPFEISADRTTTSIVVGNANRAAFEALADAENWPYHTAILIGPPRSGKSLLGKWASSNGIETVDGADGWVEDRLFHRWNQAQETGTPLLLIADSQPWNIALPDLRSRLGGSLQLEIGVPDDEMAGDLIAAHADQRGLALAAEAADYLVPRTERSFAAIEKLVETIDQLSLERKAPATMSLWRDALDQTQGPEQARLL